MSKNQARKLQVTKAPRVHTGGCHCGAVRFEVTLEPGFQASRCNCSICSRVAQTGVIVKPAAFRLLAGENAVGSYQWGGNISTRFFCKICGVHCYATGHLEEVGGDFASVNLNCADDIDPNELEIIYWDGRHDNWMAGSRRQPWPIFPKAEPMAKAS
jgi:hypothetical protein